MDTFEPLEYPLVIGDDDGTPPFELAPDSGDLAAMQYRRPDPYRSGQCKKHRPLYPQK